MTYFHMGRPHTIIGAEWFHFRVRDGIGWYPNAVVAGRTGSRQVHTKGVHNRQLESRGTGLEYLIVPINRVIAHPG